MTVFILKYDGCHNQTYSSTCLCFIVFILLISFLGMLLNGPPG